MPAIRVIYPTSNAVAAIGMLCHARTTLKTVPFFSPAAWRGEVSLCVLDARSPNLYTDLMRRSLRLQTSESPREEFMDVLFLGAVAVMFIAIVGMTIGCDLLGARQ